MIEYLLFEGQKFKDALYSKAGKMVNFTSDGRSNPSEPDLPSAVFQI